MNKTTLALLSGAASLLALSVALPGSAQQAAAPQASSEARHLPQPGLVAR